MSRAEDTCWTLIQDAALGGAEARVRFSRTYLDVVRAFLLSRWRNRRSASDAEDAVQDVFLELFRPDGALARVSREKPGGFKTFLYAVVRNGALAATRGAVRRRRREERVSQDEAWFSSTDRHLDAREATRLLAELPLEQREVIVARLWGGLTLEEVAALAGCSVATAHRRYQAGLAELHKRLEGQCNPATSPTSKAD